ncbi:MAG: IS1634 family transposase, partial [Anaerovoracaceae bacterium]
MMYPNPNYLKFFPDAELPEEFEKTNRSSLLRTGAFFVIQKIINDYKLHDLLSDIVGRDSGLFLDLACYSVITENNAAQYYPDYAYKHPLFTDNMKVYSDSTVSKFMHKITESQSVEFLNKWNESRNHKERIYISYDSANKHCSAGDIEIAEYGHAKDGFGNPIFNYAIAYDLKNREPLLYEEYPGSIVDISQLQYTLEKVKGYGYKKAEFVLDRGYFSKENIHYMDKYGYDFVIMAKGLKTLVSELVHKNKGTFEDSCKNSIRAYGVSGITVKNELFPSDKQDRYFHIYYNASKYAAERERLEAKINRMAKSLKKQNGKAFKMEESYEKYFDPIYYHKGEEDETFMYGNEKHNVIDKEISLCGYFVIITSKRMTAKDAITLYKSRDASEKLFRGDKSYLGNKSIKVHSDESADTKIFIEFVALIIRNKIYTGLKDEMIKNDNKSNNMTVPTAIRELEKIELIKILDKRYRLDHSVTATQKA